MTGLPSWAFARMPLRPWAQTRTAHPPGIAPLDETQWLQSDATYAAQMALRDDLCATAHAEVIGCLPEGEAAAHELLDLALHHAGTHHGARQSGDAIIRKDGGRVPLPGPPMDALGRLVAEDLLILSRPDGAAEHVLVAGALCFPANWMLREKIGKALMRIHLPVEEYDARLGTRVQRLHDGVVAGKPLIRANWNFVSTPILHTPTPEAEKVLRRRSRAAPANWQDAWVRVERQTLLRLPQTCAVVFGIQTMIAPLTGCTDQDWCDFHRAFTEMPEDQRLHKAGANIRAEAARRAGA
ncbi:MAG: hypothetical protein ACJAVR_002771 [Paracoccaceae bacterium]|jgi:hypothetical protein